MKAHLLERRLRKGGGMPLTTYHTLGRFIKTPRGLRNSGNCVFCLPGYVLTFRVRLTLSVNQVENQVLAVRRSKDFARRRPQQRSVMAPIWCMWCRRVPPDCLRGQCSKSANGKNLGITGCTRTRIAYYLSWYTTWAKQTYIPCSFLFVFASFRSSPLLALGRNHL